MCLNNSKLIKAHSQTAYLKQMVFLIIDKNIHQEKLA